MDYYIDAPEGLYINFTFLILELENGCSQDYLTISNVEMVSGIDGELESLKGKASNVVLNLVVRIKPSKLTILGMPLQWLQYFHSTLATLPI